MHAIRYCLSTGHRLERIEMRPDGKCLFKDLDDGSRVVCSPDAVDLIPRTPIIKILKDIMVK